MQSRNGGLPVVATLQSGRHFVAPSPARQHPRRSPSETGHSSLPVVVTQDAARSTRDSINKRKSARGVRPRVITKLFSPDPALDKLFSQGSKKQEIPDKRVDPSQTRYRRASILSPEGKHIRDRDNSYISVPPHPATLKRRVILPTHLPPLLSAPCSFLFNPLFLPGEPHSSRTWVSSVSNSVPAAPPCA